MHELLASLKRLSSTVSSKLEGIIYERRIDPLLSRANSDVNYLDDAVDDFTRIMPVIGYTPQRIAELFKDAAESIRNTQDQGHNVSALVERYMKLRGTYFYELSGGGLLSRFICGGSLVPDVPEDSPFHDIPVLEIK